MKNLIITVKNIFKSMGTGIAIGIPITIVCMICIGGWNAVVKEFLVWIIASSLFGLLSELIFKNDRMNLILSTALHCVACLIVTMSACMVNGYSDSLFELLLAVAPVFIAIYAVIYLAISFTMRKNAKEANEVLMKK